MKKVIPALGLTLGILLVASPAWAAGGGWRPIWDEVMMWVNFLILSSLIVKYGRKPLLAFLKGQGDEVARTLDEAEAGRRAAAAELDAMRKSIRERDARMAEIRARMIQDGELFKRRIVEQAQEEARFMLEEAGRRTGHEIEAARVRFRDELVDLAIRLATEGLPTVMTPEDDRRLVGKYLDESLSAS